MAPFSKPETVLKQAEGLVSVGQNHAALQSLTDIFVLKRFRSTPLASLEPIMLRFVELCVDMRKGRTAKEGLMQYKNIAQNTSVGSIEVVINHFVQLADQKVQAAQAQADRVIVDLEDVDDLEAIETPESILLGAVSGDQSKDRTDRALVTPWLKFLWESYRTALETLKNNARLELIYQQIAQSAFKFCLNHTRRIEFRRLCETLRLHLGNIAKYSHQPHSINLSDPETLQRFLDTRFLQLSAAVELELWQEAFRTVEDIHNLLTMAKKAPRPSMMTGYYEKLTRIFLMSGNGPGLYHAAAWSRYYSIVRTNPSANTVKFPIVEDSNEKDDQQMRKLSGLVLLSALSVPITARAEAQQLSKLTRLTSLLGLTRQPTRESLLASALSSPLPATNPNQAPTPLLKAVPDPVQKLYDLLERSFSPLSLCQKAAPILTELSTIYGGLYAPYVPALVGVIQSRLLGQLSQVYETIKIESLLQLVRPLRSIPASTTTTTQDEAIVEERIEAFIMSAAKRGDLSVRIDHAAGHVYFKEVEAFTPSSSSSSGQAFSEGGANMVQASASQLIGSRLSSITTALSTSLAIIQPADSTSPADIELKRLFAAAESERKALALRRSIITRRRELLNELSARKEKEDAGRRAEASKREKEEDAKRTLDDVRRKELERQRRERENVKIEEAKKLAKSLQDRGNLKVNMETVDQLDSEGLMKLQVEQLEKEKRDHNERLRIIARRLDHTERAMRKAERPLLAEDYVVQQREDAASHTALLERRLQLAKEQHKTAMQTKQRLSRTMEDHNDFKAAIAAKRGEIFDRKKEEANRRIEEEKAKRRAAVMKARAEERKRQEEEEKARQEAEEEQRKLEEERRAEQSRLEAEAQAAAEAEAAAAKAKEEQAAKMKAQREAERREADEAARRQRQREEEAELKQQQRREAARLAAQTPPRTTESSAWRRPGATPTTNDPPARPIAAGAGRGGLAGAAGGGWRARQAAKEAGENASPPSPQRRTEPPSDARTVPTPPKEPAKAAEEDGFQTVPKRAVWRPSRGRGN